MVQNEQQSPFLCQQSTTNSRSDCENNNNNNTNSNGFSIPKEEIMDSSHDKYETSYMDSNMSYTSTRQNTPHQSPMKTNAPKESNQTQAEYFTETLDLSQEDIQKTLSANMPGDERDDNDINPMDFIESCEGHQGHDDDVFVNLDAFDMLVEFPELDSGFIHSNEVKTDVSEVKKFDASTEIMQITDYSPEWAYPEGGVKVLVTGPWDANASYTVLFDSFPVPTTFVQNGVLRCYCPAHEVGVATVQVSSQGYVISNSVNFEYKSPPKLETKCESSSSDVMYKFSLLNRLETIDEKLQIKSEPQDQLEETSLFKQPNFEERLVNYCQKLSTRSWRSMTPTAWSVSHKGMTLLHLASALGYSKLVCTMLSWRADNSSMFLEREVDALSQDEDGYTALMWACAKGHIDTATILYRYNHNALNVKNIRHDGPLDVAIQKG